ncbi:YceI family protein [Cohnella fermenti]|uniref:YceI family protein n=1 Tax=Cohnella fermenti TaxID=2565925 RepID=A0A4V6RXR0_9BACL|nr:YceI family protein [Cohnella fermenti]THF84556.1 YceI family protein [Cohnella fermenti]
MRIKKKGWLIGGALAVVILGTGAYTWSNDYLGNNVDIEGVIPADASPAPSSSGSSAESASGSSAASGAAVAGEQLNGNWTISDGSKLYLSVTTSRETVNFEDEAVSGSWTLNVDDASQTTAEGKMIMDSLGSGNSMRDGHVKGTEYLNVSEFPEATFQATSFEGIPAEWTEGVASDIKITGTLTVKDIAKEVTFDAKTMYRAGQVLLSAATVVTFADFGMENPHSVVLDTQNDLTVQLELVLEKA